MRHPLITLTLTLAMTLPQLATPVMADQRGYTHRHGEHGPLHLAPSNDSPAVTGSGLGTGIAVLGGLALAAALAKQARERREAEQRAAGRDHGRGHGRGHGHARGDDRGHERGHGHGHRRGDLKRIPERCFRQGYGPRGSWRGYGARCMERTVARPRLLPDECLRRVRTDRGSRTVYRGRCLARNGWSRSDQARRR